MGINKVHILVFLSSVTSCSSQTKCEALRVEEETEQLNYMIPNNYNGQLPPFKPGCPVEVSVTMMPWGIGDISIEHMWPCMQPPSQTIIFNQSLFDTRSLGINHPLKLNFEVNLYLKMEWVDYRLNITNLPGMELKLTEKLASVIWTPDVAFRNCISCKAIRFDHRYQKLSLDGNSLWFFVRTSAKLFCDFNIANYPMDKHVCFIEVETYGDTKDTVILLDATPQHGFLRNSSIPQFEVTDMKTGKCSTPDGTSYYVTCVEYKMTFTRQLEYHLMLTYAPSLLIVVLTWISFWLEVEVAPPRVALGLTSLLTLATQFANAQKNLPPVSYAKAIDIWMFTCIFMVFGSLFEFAIAYNLEKRKKAQLKPPSFQPWAKTKLSLQLQIAKKENNVDSVSKVMFPLMFLVFNISYWGYFCTR